MAISFDKQRQQYIVRVQVAGVRHYVGRYDLEKQAEAAEARYYKRLADVAQQTLDSVELEYEAHNDSIEWLKPFRKLKAALAKRRVEKKEASRVQYELEDKL